MAKKKTSDFNMAEEIRNLLKENRNLTGSEVFAAIRKASPGRKLNKNSFGVAFYSARKKMGIKSGKRRKAGGKVTVVKKRPAVVATVNIEALQAAAKFVSAVGDAENAIAAVKQIRLLQIK